MHIHANYHTHTVLCDGLDTPEAMAEQAAAIGFTALGFSGHMDPDIHMDISRYYREISRLKKQYQGRLDILMGVELDNLYDPHAADEAEYVIGSTHFLDVPSDAPLSVDADPDIMLRLGREFYGGDFYALARDYYALEARVYDRIGKTEVRMSPVEAPTGVTQRRPFFVGHFDLITRFNDDLHFLDEADPRYTEPALAAMEYLVMEGVPFEVNCGAVNRGRKKELYPNRFLLRALHDFGGEILISSDAHQKKLLDGGFDIAITRARACGFDHINLLSHGPDGKIRWTQQGI